MKLRMRIAYKLYDLFPRNFCWADLAVWGMGYHSFFKVFTYWGKSAGCVHESMESLLSECSGKNSTCYCGCWHHGHHCSSKQGDILKADAEEYSIKNPVVTDLPF
jgi:hypothetical protein